MPTTALAARILRPAAVLVVAVVTMATAACGSDDTASAAPEPAPTSASGAGVLDVRDPWVKAADQGMTAAFGTFVNDSASDVTVTAVATDVSPMELHEMAMKDGAMVMQAKQGGITIRANSRHVLEPGGDHLMLMNLAKPVRPGDELAFTLTFGDGRTQVFTAVVKPFTGAKESYDPGHGMPGVSGSPGMSMSPRS
jgi:copper(I)-binding protein